MDPHERYAHQILSEIEGGAPISQRSLAGRLGIALGLTNLLVRRVVRKGWVKVIRIRPNRMRYLLTPAGIVEKARISRLFLQDSVRFYSSARDRIRSSLTAVAEGGANGGDPRRRIVFYGAGELAEIAYICLQETDLELVGVIDDSNRSVFLGLPVHSCQRVREGGLAALSFDCVLVTSFESRDVTARQLEDIGISSDRIHWL